MRVTVGSVAVGAACAAVSAVAAVAAVALPAAAASSRGNAVFRIDHVADGDTVTLTNGQRVRFVQIDTPEV